MERLALTAAFLERPGLGAAALVEALAAAGTTVHRRTAYRLLARLASPAGGLARWRLTGPSWVCWGCGRAIETADAAAVREPRGRGILPLDLGGYCAACQEAPPRRPGPASRTPRGRGAPLVPIGALYRNPNLLREILGSSRRLPGRDYIVANLAEHPRSSPAELHRRLAEELAVTPGLRTVKRVSGALRGPKARMLLARLGAVAWWCAACEAWGPVAAAPLFEAAPPGFWPTDIRGLCSACQDRVQRPPGSPAPAPHPAEPAADPAPDPRADRSGGAS